MYNYSVCKQDVEVSLSFFSRKYSNHQFDSDNVICLYNLSWFLLTERSLEENGDLSDIVPNASASFSEDRGMYSIFHQVKLSWCIVCKIKSINQNKL